MSLLRKGHHLVLVALFWLAAVSPGAADTWIETGDAGSFISHSQIVTIPCLTTITGSLFNETDVDLYKLSIFFPAKFRASTVGGANFNTMLFLFDINALGVLADDDDQASGTTQSTLSPGTSLQPSTPGLYYLAIAAYEAKPGGNSSSQYMFSGETILAPDGNYLMPPDIASGPLGFWTTNVPAMTKTDYTITLEGTCVPLPGAAWLFGGGLLGLLGLAGKRVRNR